ncbi:hypothetical protein OVY29_22800 [Sphingopyxis sp. SE2]|uniref:hypothetical protein n=1 Tax=Sphingopyxis sp. SE2 TaxID=1586240 RepID=UPI0028C097B0|nr:hypothetical protein [Sphingopyxis sp. SE2]MDT7531489.1 hypothetical protein [Sphingopyxis sp. SE2]
MRVHCSIIVLSLAAAWSARALAQEVALLDFKSVPGIDVSTDKTPVAMSAGKFVAQSMQAHFDEGPLAGDSQIGGSIAFDRADPPTVGLAISAPTRGRRSTSLLMPDIPDGYGSGRQTGGGSYCDGASYVPTWWLSREVEARRAMGVTSRFVRQTTISRT